MLLKETTIVLSAVSVIVHWNEHTQSTAQEELRQSIHYWIYCLVHETNKSDYN